MKARTYDLVLAFNPHARGFAYVVFEGPDFPVDWGMSDVPREKKGKRCLRRLHDLLDQYNPGVLVVPEKQRGAAREQSAGLFREMTSSAERRDVPIVAISRKQVRNVFAFLRPATRYAVAEAIVREIPVFAPLAPPIRKIWNGEDRRMGLFDAIALAQAFYRSHDGDGKSADNLRRHGQAKAALL